MSGNEERGLKRLKNLFPYVPLGVEVLISFLPFLILVGVCLNWLLGEIANYKTGLNWNIMVKLVEAESCRFEEWMEDEELEKLDLAVRHREDSLPDRGWRLSLDLSRFAEGEASEDGSEVARIQYIFYGDDGSLMSCDPIEGEFSVIPKDNDFYEQAMIALFEKTPKESLQRVFYELDGDEYYACFMMFMPTKQVSFGNRLLCDGRDGSRILISGQFCYDAIAKAAGMNKKRVNIYVILMLLAFALIICLAVFWSLRSLRKIINIMKRLSMGETNFTESELTLDDRIGAPEVWELMESYQLMFLSLLKYQESIANIREKYEPLLPAAFLALFNEKDIREIRPGDKAVAAGKVLFVRLVSSSRAGQEDISARNRLLSRILEILIFGNMLVTELEYDRITALLPAEAGEGTSLDQVIRDIRSLDLKDSDVDEIIVTDAEGEFCYTVVGTAKYMTINMEQISAKGQEIEDKNDEGPELDTEYDGAAVPGQ